MSNKSELFFVVVETLWHLKRAQQRQTAFMYILIFTAVLPDPAGYTATNFKRM